MSENLVKFCSLICLAFALVLTSDAQDRKCDLQIDFFEYKTVGNRQIPSEMLDFVLVNLKTGERKNPGLTKTIFNDLVSGKYKIQVTAENFKPRVKEFELDCNFTNGNNVFLENLYLWKKKSDRKKENDSPETLVKNSVQSKEESGNLPAEVANNVKGIGNDSTAISSSVKIEVTIDEDGNVFAARAIKNNSLLAGKAITAAMQAKFSPTMLSGVPIKVTGIIVYNFIK